MVAELGVDWRIVQSEPMQGTIHMCRNNRVSIGARSESYRIRFTDKQCGGLVVAERADLDLSISSSIHEFVRMFRRPRDVADRVRVDKLVANRLLVAPFCSELIHKHNVV
jgi:hypothetical protein